MDVQVVERPDRARWLALRAPNMNSSQVAALYGCHPYLTEFTLWHRHAGNLVVDDDKDAAEHVKWGTRLEEPIARGMAEDFGWDVEPYKDYVWSPSLRAGSSFDFRITKPERGLLEIKNVFGPKFRLEWIQREDDTLEPPPHIELQCHHEMWIEGLRDPESARFVELGALVSGNQIQKRRIERNEDVIAKIAARVAKYWADFAAGIEPVPDFSRDAESIDELYRHALVRAKDVRSDEVMKDLAYRHEEWRLAEKAAKEEKEAIGAEILHTLGSEYSKAIGAGFNISCATVPEAWIEPSPYMRRAYRPLRITFPGQKKEKKHGQ